MSIKFLWLVLSSTRTNTAVLIHPRHFRSFMNARTEASMQLKLVKRTCLGVVEVYSFFIATVGAQLFWHPDLKRPSVFCWFVWVWLRFSVFWNGVLAFYMLSSLVWNFHQRSFCWGKKCWPHVLFPWLPTIDLVYHRFSYHTTSGYKSDLFWKTIVRLVRIFSYRFWNKHFFGFTIDFWTIGFTIDFLPVTHWSMTQVTADLWFPGLVTGSRHFTLPKSKLGLAFLSRFQTTCLIFFLKQNRHGHGTGNKIQITSLKNPNLIFFDKKNTNLTLEKSQNILKRPIQHVDFLRYPQELRSPNSAPHGSTTTRGPTELPTNCVGRSPKNYPMGRLEIHGK